MKAPESGIELKDVFKKYSYDQDKVRDPAETIEWVKERFRSSGREILLKTLRIDTGRLGIPVYISLCGPDATRLTGTRKQMGKGATPEQSQASALMELAERFSFFSYFRERSLPVFSWKEAQPYCLSVRHLLMAIHDDVTSPEEAEGFLADVPLRWAPAANLTKGVDVWVPFDWFYLINEYNGPAAGNTLEEAVVQSLAEVVERHVGTLVSYRKIPTPLIDVDTVQDTAAVDLIKKFQSKGIVLYLRDFSLDTGIPSVGVLAYDPSTFPERSEIVFTVGTTPGPAKALCRALTEVAQLAGDFENRTSYKPTFPKYRSLEEASYLADVSARVSLSSLPDLSDENILEEIRKMVQSLADTQGWEVLVVNTTHPDLRVPAVYTIVPGAHFLDRATGTDFPQHMARVLVKSLPPAEAVIHLQRLTEKFGRRYDLIFFLGYALEESGNIDDALRLYEVSLNDASSDDERASVLVHIASCYRKRGEFKKALSVLDKAEALSPDMKELHHLKGVCLYNLKKHKESIESFERVVELDPGSAIDYANIASNLRELGHVREAIFLYRMALDLDPTLDFARENLEKLSASQSEIR
ncbi:YcaO-like family protein [Thermodesulforhabdus norvegica]|uniref:Ribosomal protein S12 methylthiotransferase accessory factor n=1 Tax=Thermodesulforhabdus norvegica TaxID=39841 RepID=A0A1I4QIJ5_9BACT|nr:YcaO-like family protein [Thermodesulforhabdus norvegica]SFM39854.1 ribosomal protein S12 methylthiotransferase accessory factor [Thermodesulforhabdus norvegica]